MANVQVHLLDGHQLTVDENDRLADSSVQSLNGVTAGTVTASKFVKADANKDVSGLRNVTATGSFIIGSADMNETDLEKLDGITNGTAAASKAVVLDSNGAIDVIKFGAIGASDSSLAIDGQAAAQGGAVVMTGGTSSTAGNAGGVSKIVGGTPGATGVGGKGQVIGAAGGSTSGKGGASEVTGGAGTAGNAAGGSTIITPGAAHGSGLAGGNFLRSAGGLHFRQQTAATAKSDGAESITAAQMINGIVVFTVTTGRTLTTPTGAAILAGCPTDIATGDSFDLSVITIGTGADDIATLTAGDGDVTFVGNVTVGPDSATNNGYGTWRFRYAGANAFVGYRIG